MPKHRRRRWRRRRQSRKTLEPVKSAADERTAPAHEAIPPTVGLASQPDFYLRLGKKNRR